MRHCYGGFDDDHPDINYRIDVSLLFLYRALLPCRPAETPLDMRLRGSKDFLAVGKLSL